MCLKLPLWIAVSSVILIFHSATMAQPTPSAEPQTLETVTTESGLSLSFPAQYYAALDADDPTVVYLTLLDESFPLTNLSIRDVSAAEPQRTPTLDELQEQVTSEIRLIGSLTRAEPQELALDNGMLRILPYRLEDDAEGIDFLLELNGGGRLVLAETLLGTDTSVERVLNENGVWMDILNSITFRSGPVDASESPILALPEGPLTLAQMPDNAIVFENDVALTLPADWSASDSAGPAQADARITDTVTLRYSAADALVTINVVDLANASFIDWRNALLTLMSGALTMDGQAPLSAAFPLPGGGVVERYASADLSLAVYFVDLGDGQAVYALANVIVDGRSQRTDVLDSCARLLSGLYRFRRATAEN